MKSLVVKRSVVIAGHKTSVSLEDAFWKALHEIAAARKMTLTDLISSVDSERKHPNLSSAIRLYILDFHRSHIAEAAAHAAPATPRASNA
ncbi:MAG TPA: ribbon-helix-helix domain-containing protein [Xanthobacteraceae bacterium]|jgi:predicted DNA-binding ribbon-helix-helix protein|nr:ribbon-helix-helix domain-containing protein [Xanthobacteraceae bacterium]